MSDAWEWEADAFAEPKVARQAGPPIARPLASADFGTRTDGLAHVFLNDPADVTFVEVTLPDLEGDGSRLEGPFVRAGSDRLDGPTEAAPSLTASDFRFQPDTTTTFQCNTDLSVCSRFDAVNVYYHIDRYVRDYWIAKLGVDVTFKANARVHIGGDGAFASGTDFVLKFKVGDIFMKNAALSDDLIYHEYGHLIAASLGFNPTSQHTDQTRALSEAYADYFTASYTNDPRIGEWVVTCPDRQHCVGPENDREIRTLLLDAETWNWRQGQPSPDLAYGFCLRYHPRDQKCKASHNNFANHYVWGMIWASALWDLRLGLGADVADRLALDALDLHTVDTDFADAVADLKVADQSRFGGQYWDDIQAVFSRRGFIIPVNEGTEAEANPVEPGLQVWPNPATGQVHIAVPSGEVGPFALTWYDVTGRQVRSHVYGSSGIVPETITEDTSRLVPGMYLLVLSNARGTVRSTLSAIH